MLTNKKIKMKQIEKLRKQIGNMMIQNNMKIDGRILKMSQKLDILIINYYQLQ